MMFLYTLLSLSFAEDDVFDLVDKKAKVSNHEYLNFDIHHQAPIEKKYVFGYYPNATRLKLETAAPGHSAATY